MATVRETPADDNNVQELGEEGGGGGAREESQLAAPDVTYDVTMMDSVAEQPSEGMKEEGEGEDGGESNEAKKEESIETAKEGKDKEEEEEEISTDRPPEQKGEKEEEEKKEEEEEWIDILGSGELKKKVLSPGGGLGSRPTPQCRVQLRTRGVLDYGGGVVDVHRAVPFTLGDGDVIQAWDLATSLMEAGETALVKTSARFAYGKMGRAPDVPADAAITYELELLDVKEPVNFEAIEEGELIILADRKRIRGNELFQRKEFDLAINSYDRGLKLLESFIEERGSSNVSSRVEDMMIRCLNNIAAAQLKVEMYKDSQEACQKVLKKDPDNVKALFRSGKVYAIQGELEKAVANLKRALELNPSERAISTELVRTTKKKEKMEKDEKEMYRRMVQGVGEGRGEKTTQGRGGKEGSTPVRRDRWGPFPYLAIAGLIASVGIAISYFLTQR